MTKPFRKAFILFAFAISAVVLLIISLQKAHKQPERKSSASSDSEGPDDVGGSEDSQDGPPVISTRSTRIRPSPEEIAKNRLEKQFIELVRKLQMMRDGGLNDQHPTIKATLEELAKNPDIRTELQNSTTYALWTRGTAKNGLQFTQYQFAVGGAVALKSVHRVDPNGSVLGSKIFDDRDNQIFMVRYGYHKDSGMLVEEQVYDSRERLLDYQGIEIPIRRIVHSINAADGALESSVVDLPLSSLPPQMEMGFRNPFLQQ